MQGPGSPAGVTGRGPVAGRGRWGRGRWARVAGRGRGRGRGRRAGVAGRAGRWAGAGVAGQRVAEPGSPGRGRRAGSPSRVAGPGSPGRGRRAGVAGRGRSRRAGGAAQGAPSLGRSCGLGHCVGIAAGRCADFAPQVITSHPIDGVRSAAKGCEVRPERRVRRVRVPRWGARCRLGVAGRVGVRRAVLGCGGPCWGAAGRGGVWRAAGAGTARAAVGLLRRLRRVVVRAVCRAAARAEAAGRLCGRCRGRRRQPVQPAGPTDEQRAARRHAAAAVALFVGMVDLDQAMGELRHPCERLDRQVPSRVSRPHMPTVALCGQQ